VLLVEIFVLAGRTWATGASATRGSLSEPVDGQDLGNVERVARVLFTDFLWAFELTAALLVIAVVGAVVLARRSSQKPEMDAEDREIAETELAYAGEAADSVPPEVTS
jgi:hypothetical protein